MQKSIIFASTAIKLFDPQLFGLKSLTGKLMFILHPAFCQAILKSIWNPEEPKLLWPGSLCVKIHVVGFVLALIHRIWHLSWVSGSPCNQQKYLWRWLAALPQRGMSAPGGVLNHSSRFTDHGSTWRTNFHLMLPVDQVRWIPSKVDGQVSWPYGHPLQHACASGIH